MTLTRDDYMVLICAALCEEDPPVVTRKRYEKLRELGLVRKIISVGDTHVVIRTVPKGRDMAIEYVKQYSEEET